MSDGNSLQKRSTLLFGAGLSCAPPSCAPSTSQLKNIVISSIKNALSPSGMWCESSKEEQSLMIAISTIQFEVFMQLVWRRISGNSLDILYSILKFGKPNLHHYAISEGLMSGLYSLVLTTNQDLYLEKALKEVCERNSFSVVYGTECPPDAAHIHRLCNEEEYRQFDGSCPAFCKLHGSVDELESLRITMQQVGSLLPPGKDKIISLCMKKGLVIEGYGGHDFDISCSIERHYSDEKIPLYRVRSKESIARLGSLKDRLAFDFEITDSEMLMSQSESAELSAQSQRDKVILKFNSSIQEISGVDLLSFMADILEKSEYQELALVWRKRALNSAISEKASDNIIFTCLLNQVTSYIELKEWNSAIIALKDIDISKAESSSNLLAQFHSHFGTALLRNSISTGKGSLIEAKTHYQTAAKYWKELVVEDFEKDDNLDLINLDNSHLASMYYETLLNIAATDFEAGDLSSAENRIFDLLPKLERLGQKSMICVCYMNLCGIYIQKQLWEKLVHTARMAYLLGKDLNDVSRATTSAKYLAYGALITSRYLSLSKDALEFGLMYFKRANLPEQHEHFQFLLEALSSKIRDIETT